MQQIDEGLGSAYTQLRELLGTFRLSIGDANLGEAIKVMLEQLKRRPRPTSGSITVWPIPISKPVSTSTSCS